nr:hypothetical protein [Devosia ginsengisoli]
MGPTLAWPGPAPHLAGLPDDDGGNGGKDGRYDKAPPSGRREKAGFT